MNWNYVGELRELRERRRDTYPRIAVPRALLYGGISGSLDGIAVPSDSPYNCCPLRYAVYRAPYLENLRFRSPLIVSTVSRETCDGVTTVLPTPPDTPRYVNSLVLPRTRFRSHRTDTITPNISAAFSLIFPPAFSIRRSGRYRLSLA